MILRFLKNNIIWFQLIQKKHDLIWSNCFSMIWFNLIWFFHYSWFALIWFELFDWMWFDLNCFDWLWFDLIWNFLTDCELNWFDLIQWKYLWFDLICILIHDYTLCFSGSPCYNVNYYNYISIWPYYIVIHLKENDLYLPLIPMHFD